MNDKIKEILKNHGKSLSKETIDCLFEIIEVLIEDSDSKVDDYTLKPTLPLIKNLVYSYINEILE